VVTDVLEAEGVTTETLRVVDHDVRPGVENDLDSDAGKDWSHETGRAAASNLLAVARALQERPVPAPPG
jgi:hypothetical protein